MNFILYFVVAVRWRKDLLFFPIEWCGSLSLLQVCKRLYKSSYLTSNSYIFITLNTNRRGFLDINVAMALYVTEVLTFARQCGGIRSFTWTWHLRSTFNNWKTDVILNVCAASIWRCLMFAPQVFNILFKTNSSISSVFYFYFWEMIIFILMVCMHVKLLSSSLKNYLLK